MIMITDNVTMMLGFRIRIQIECIRTHKVTALKKPWLLVGCKNFESLCSKNFQLAAAR